MDPIIEKHLGVIDGVVFDFGGVIVRAPQGEWKVLSLLSSLGIDKEKAFDLINFHRRAFDGGDITCREMYEKILAQFSKRADNGFYEELYRADSEGWTDFSEDTLNTMKELKHLGKKVGILSNMSKEFYEDYFSKMAGDYLALCDSVIISSKYRITKPDRRIYDISAKDIEISPSRLLFLDDNMPNVEAAINYGWLSERYLAK